MEAFLQRPGARQRCDLPRLDAAKLGEAAGPVDDMHSVKLGQARHGKGVANFYLDL